MPPTHTRGCQLRWVAATWVLTVVLCSIPDLTRLSDLPPIRDLVAFYLAVAVVGLGTSVVAVSLLARLPYGVPALVATPVAGFLIGYARALLTYGSGAEDGTVWRGYGGAMIGLVSAIAAWVLLRSAHRFLSRETCRTPSPVE